ncbi:MAG: zinc ABC transporter substrate-binding protein [Planctomycetota bacterium]
MSRTEFIPLPFLRIGIGIGFGVVLFAVVIVAIFGEPANRPVLAAGSSAESGIEPLKTFAGIPPVAYLVQRIGGPYVHVEVLVPAGQDPHIFEPTPRQVIRLSQARLFFRVGMPFEDRLIGHLVRGSANFTVVDTAAGIAARASSCVCEAAHCGHGHDQANKDDGDDDDDEVPADPHVWLSPPLLKTMAANVAKALCQADPRHEQVYRTNLKTLLAKLDALNHRIAQSLLPYRGQAFYVFHPAFGYFADTYGLRQESVEVEGKPPAPRQIFDLINKARNDHVKIIFLQPQFNQQIAASIAQAIGGVVIPMDSTDYDVVANLEDVAQKIAASNREKTE